MARQSHKIFTKGVSHLPTAPTILKTFFAKLWEPTPDLFFIKKLLKRTPDLSKQNDPQSNLPAICIACQNGSTQLLRLLIHKGADVNVIISEGFFYKNWTPMRISIHLGKLDFVKLLLSEGTKLTPHHFDEAILKKDYEIFDALLTFAERNYEIEDIKAVILKNLNNLVTRNISENLIHIKKVFIIRILETADDMQHPLVLNAFIDCFRSKTNLKLAKLFIKYRIVEQNTYIDENHQEIINIYYDCPYSKHLDKQTPMDVAKRYKNRDGILFLKINKIIHRYELHEDFMEGRSSCDLYY